MPKSENQKQKLLYIEKYLRTHTDETHSVTTPQLIAYLAENIRILSPESVAEDYRNYLKNILTNYEGGQPL